MKNNFGKFFLFFIIITSTFFFLPQKVYKKRTYNYDTLINLNNKSINTTDAIEAFCTNDKELKLINFKTGVVQSISVQDNKYLYANNNFYILYDKLESKAEVYSFDNKLLSTITASGYPFVTNVKNHFIIIKENGLGFSLFSINGKKIFDDINLISMITSINIDDELNTLVSTLDGYTYIVSKNGKKIFEKISNDSKIILAKSNTIDRGGKFFAFSYGLYPEYIEVRRMKDKKKVLKIKTETNFRYSNILSLVNNVLYYESADGIDARSLISGRKFFYRIKGAIIEVCIDNFNNLVVSSELNNIFFLTVYSKSGDVIYYNEFKNPVDNIKIYGSNYIYFRTADELVRLIYGETV